VYVSDTVGRRLLRLNQAASRLEIWSADGALVSPDGIAVLADGVYVGNARPGELLRVGVNADGSAGAVTKIATSRTLENPDGMRSVDDHTLLLTETVGRLDEVTVRDGYAEVRVVKEGLVASTAVTLVNGTAYVTEFDPTLKDQDPGPFRAVAVPYGPR
jgi:hypothetical protein